MNSAEALAWIAEVFEEPSGRIGAATQRAEIPGWDSLGTLSLIAGLDERFDIQLSERDIERMECVADILKILAHQGQLDVA